MTATKILIGNQKGGSGKTTTTANLAATLAELGYQVLAFDFDPQAQLAEVLGAVDLLEYHEKTGELLSPSIADVLIVGNARQMYTLADAIVETPFEGIDLVPGSLFLETTIHAINANSDAGKIAVRDLFSDESLGKLEKQYDFIVMDSAPKIDNLLTALMKAVDFIVPVLGPESLQVSALSRFAGHVKVAKQENPGLRLLPAVINKANMQWSKSVTSMGLLRDIEIEVYEHVIPTYAKIEASAEMGPVIGASPNSREAGIVRQVMMQIVDDVAKVDA